MERETGMKRPVVEIPGFRPAFLKAEKGGVTAHGNDGKNRRGNADPVRVHVRDGFWGFTFSITDFACFRWISRWRLNMQCQPWGIEVSEDRVGFSFRFSKLGEAGDGSEVVFDGGSESFDLFLARVIGGHDIFLWIADAGVSWLFAERERPDDFGDGAVHDRVVLEDHVERPAAHVVGCRTGVTGRLPSSGVRASASSR